MLFRSQISKNQCFLRFQPLKPSEPFKNLRIFNILTPGVTEALQKPKVFLVLSNWSLQNPSKTKGFSIFWPLGSLGPFKNLRFFRFSVLEAFRTLKTYDFECDESQQRPPNPSKSSEFFDVLSSEPGKQIPLKVLAPEAFRTFREAIDLQYFIPWSDISSSAAPSHELLWRASGLRSCARV